MDINYLLRCHAPHKMSTFATFNTFQLNFNFIITALRYFLFPYSHSFAAWTNFMSSIQFRLHVSLNHYKTLLAMFSPFFFSPQSFWIPFWVLCVLAAVWLQSWDQRATVCRIHMTKYKRKKHLVWLNCKNILVDTRRLH